MRAITVFEFFNKAVGATTGKVFSGLWGLAGKAMVTAYVTGTGAVAANVAVYGSNDFVYWHLLGTIALTDTDEDSDILAIDYPWKYIRADTDLPTGTGAAVTAQMSI